MERFFSNRNRYVCSGSRPLFFKNLYEIKAAGYDFIVACPLRKLNKTTAGEILSHFHSPLPHAQEKNGISPFQMELELKQRFKEPENNQYTDRAVSGFLTVEFSESRTNKDRTDREKLIDKIRNKIGVGKKSPKALISNNGYKKFVASCEDGVIELNEKKISDDAQWGGIHGIFSSRKLDPADLRARYRHLWTIEETFRVAKTDLKIRPIYHWKKSRILAHISICYMSLAIIRHVELVVREQGLCISPRKINETLTKIQSCVVRDKKSAKKFKIPVQITESTQRFLDALKISHKKSVTTL